MSSRPIRRVGLVPALVLALAGCTSPPAPDDVVAGVDGLPIYRVDLEHYLRQQLPDPDPENKISERVLSRMLDALLDEYTLLAEAERRGLEVGEDEIAAYLAAAEDGEPPAPYSDPPAARRLARRRMLIHRLELAIAAGLPRPGQHELQTWIDSDPRRASERRLRLRSLPFAGEEEAATVRARIASRTVSFDEAVLAQDSGAELGTPVVVSWSMLDREVQEAIEDLPPGAVSRPVALHGEVFLFVVESWEVPVRAGAPAGREILEKLQQARMRRATEELLERLRGQREVEVHARRLGFAYVPV